MALPPTPRGYKKVDLGGILAVVVLSCDKCGALTVFHKTHTEWHKKVGN